MIDKYKKPRVQRFVPERTRLRAVRRYATPCLVMSTLICAALREAGLQQALLSGAMPGEVDGLELRLV